MSEELSATQLLRRARRYRPLAARVTAVFRGGVENVAYLIDDDLVLKHARPGQPRGWLAREAAILQAIRAPNLPVPQFAGYDEESGLPVLCASLVPGTSLESLPDLLGESRTQVLGELGQVLVRLHEIVLPGPAADCSREEAVLEPCVGRRPGLVRRWRGGMEVLRAEGLIRANQCDWLELEFKRLLIDCPDQPVVLLHNDIKPGPRPGTQRAKNPSGRDH